MVVSFSSAPCDDFAPQHDGDPATNKAAIHRAAVLIGTSPNRLTKIVYESPSHGEYSGESPHPPVSPRWYNATEHLHKGTEREVYHIYRSEIQRHVLVEGLRPDTRYYYRCVVLRDDGIDSIGGILEEKIRDEEEDSEEEEEERKFRRKRKTRRKRRRLTNPAKVEKYVRYRIGKVRHKIDKGVIAAPDAVPSFRTAPETGTAGSASSKTASSTKLAIIGDVALTEPALDTLSHLNDDREDIAMILCVGDIAYANGVHALWDSFMDVLDLYGPTFHHMPLMVAPGNHEVERDHSQQIFASYEARFHMPQIRRMVGGSYDHSVDMEDVPYPLPYDFGNAFYSFRLGLAHHIVLNSFGDFRPGSVQYEWLVHELQSNVDRNITPWLTVTTHCPIYNTFKWHRHDPQSLLAQRYLEPLFCEHGVNFVLSGHLHAYQRTHPVNNGTLDQKGPMHIILGNGGRQANTPYYRRKPESWVAVRDHTTYGYGTLDFVNATHARYEWIQTDVNDVSTQKVRLEEGGANVDKAKHRGIRDKIFVRNQLYL